MASYVLQYMDRDGVEHRVREEFGDDLALALTRREELRSAGDGSVLWMVFDEDDPEHGYFEAEVVV